MRRNYELLKGLLLISILLFLIPCSPWVSATQGIDIELGHLHETLELAANLKNADTGVNLVAGHKYSISSIVVESLCDASIKVPNTEGFQTSEVKKFFSRLMLRIFVNKKRVKDTNWFFLIGYIDEDHDSRQIKIGSDTEFIARQSGRLYVYLNDHPWFYYNNMGSYRLRITKIRKEK